MSSKNILGLLLLIYGENSYSEIKKPQQTMHSFIFSRWDRFLKKLENLVDRFF